MQPDLTFPQILPHKAVTVSHIEMSKDYGFPCWTKELYSGLSCVSCVEYDYSSRQHQMPDFSRSLQSRGFWRCIVLSIWKYLPRSCSFLAFQNNLEGSVDWGLHFSFAVSNITTLGFPSLPPFSLSPIFLPFAPSMGAESCCFLFWSFLSFPLLSSLGGGLGCAKRISGSIMLSVMCLFYVSEFRENKQFPWHALPILRDVFEWVVLIKVWMLNRKRFWISYLRGKKTNI